MAPELAAGIARVKSAKSVGTGNICSTGSPGTSPICELPEVSAVVLEIVEEAEFFERHAFNLEDLQNDAIPVRVEDGPLENFDEGGNLLAC